MPSYKVHLTTGLIVSTLAGFLAWKYGQLPLASFTWYATIPVVILYSLLPDVDIETSKVWHAIATLLILTTAIGAWAAYHYHSLTYLLIALASMGALLFTINLRHRCAAHTFKAALLLSAPLLLIGWLTALAGLIAYASHLAADGITTRD